VDNKQLYYLKNKARILKKRAEYREKNKLKISENKKKDYQKNKDKILKKRAEYVKVHKEKIKLASKLYWEQNKKKITDERKDYLQQYRKHNREKLKIAALKYNKLATKKYQSDVGFRDKYLNRKKNYLKENPNKLIKFRKNRYKKLKIKYYSDSYYRLALTLRSRLRMAIKAQNTKKYLKAEELVGCSIHFLKEYLTKLFSPGMTWENQGEWHIDHIIPVAKFDLRDPEQQKTCFHFTNLQPLWASDNIRKGKK
jgi:hypothetical protein